MSNVIYLFERGPELDECRRRHPAAPQKRDFDAGIRRSSDAVDAGIIPKPGIFEGAIGYSVVLAVNNTFPGPGDEKPTLRSGFQIGTGRSIDKN